MLPRRPTAWLQSYRVRFALVAVGAIAIFVLLAFVRGTPQDAAWYVLHVGGFAAIALVTSFRRWTPIAVAALTASAIGLPALGLIVAFTPLDPWNEPLRLQLFTDNPNLLAADVIALLLGAVAVRPQGRWTLLLPPVAIVVALTGSRTALIALGVAVLIWLALPRLKAIERLLLVAGVVAFVGVVGFATWQVGRELRLDNLMGVSTTFDDRSWTVYGDSIVDVDRSAAPGPWPGTRADRIRAATFTSRLTLYQSLGRSGSGTDYVASVYLRSVRPQVVVLSNRLSQTTCQVDTTWRRCVTPPGHGNGRSPIQFRFETPQPGHVFDVYAFGPQYQVGTGATKYQARTGGIVSRHLLARLATIASVDAWSLPRLEHTGLALQALRAAPVAGSGLDWTSSYGDDGQDHVTHAHNFLAEHLAVDGLVGAVVWFVLVTLGSWRIVRSCGAWSLPFLVALFVLNAFDYTIFHAGSFATTAILLGASIARDRLADDRGDSCATTQASSNR